MKKTIFNLLGLSIAALFVMTMVYSCGSSSSSSSGTSGTATGTVTLAPTSGTLDAVNLNSMLIENISASIGNKAGTVDPTSIQISISPSFNFTTTQGFNMGTFAGYVDIVPEGFLPAGQTFSVTTNFNAVISGKNYSFTEYNTFTTVSTTGTNAVEAGKSFIINITNVTQPSALGSLLAGNIPPIAIKVITSATASTSASVEGSLVLYGGEAASNSSPTDITSNGFTIPLAAIYKGNEFMSFGSATISVSGITVPLQTFDLSGIGNQDGTISNGVLFGVVHCTDPSCTNLGSTVGGVVSQYIDGNGNMTVLGTFDGVPNTVPYKDWITASDTATLTLSTSSPTATLNVAPGANLINTTYLPFIILTQTDSNNIISITAFGQGTTSTTSSSVTINYPLTTSAGNAFTPTAGTTYTAYTLFGLSVSPTTPFSYTP